MNQRFDPLSNSTSILVPYFTDVVMRAERRRNVCGDANLAAGVHSEYPFSLTEIHDF